jgi:hypothetical protein
LSPLAVIEVDTDAMAFWTDLAPQRESVQKTIRRYVVEVEK